MIFYKKPFHLLHTSILVLSLGACAQIGSPGGGRRDVTPPKVVRYIPDSASTNIKPKSIFIVFDEYITLKGMESQLVISPPLEKAPDIKVKDKGVLITFSREDTLKPNTTYVFSFGNAIQDINENNPKDNFKYVFSTGSFIDSLVVKGRVQTAFDHKTEKGLLVMLYRNYTDSSVYKGKPDYFAKTKDDGTFQITNVREGNYKVVALKDVNANYKYDSDDEKIAFIDTLVNVPATNDLMLELFQEPPKKFHLKKHTYNSYGKIDFSFNKGSDSIEITPINVVLDKEDVIFDYSVNRDMLTYWFRNVEKDSLILQVSNGSKIIDTIELKLIKKENALKDKKNPLKLKVLRTPDKKMNFELGSFCTLTFSAPIVKYNYAEEASLEEYADGVRKQLKSIFYFNDDWYNLTLYKYDSAHKVEDRYNPGALISKPLKTPFDKWKPGANYFLFIPPATFTDFFGFTNDSINIHFKTRDDASYGSLKLQINIPATDHNYIVQLLDGLENAVRSYDIRSSETITCEHLSPGKYKLKIIDDTNHNFKWDNGNFSKNKQPEKVIYNSEVINVRANWDLDLKWDVK